MAKRSGMRVFCGVLQSIIVTAAIYGLLYAGVLVSQRVSLPKTPAELYKKPVPYHRPGFSSPDSFRSSEGLPPAKLEVEKINAKANWFNRPESLVTPRDNYLGKRPHVDTVANLTKLVEECRGSYENLEKMPYVYDCLKWLRDGEKEYYYLPSHNNRASKQFPKHAEYLNSDGADNTLLSYPSYKPATKDSRGRCNGPIVPYHVYWTGPATWRVELFIKSYLHTQNLPCVRLFLWLDGDRDPNIVQNFLHHDPLFAKFLLLVKRGDILLKTWKFPSRIALPKGYDHTDGAGYYKSPRSPNSKNETLVADGLIREGQGQEWLVLTEKQMTFLPVAVSDAVRFIVLHMCGGAYFDMDIIMLRDMRPLLIGPTHSFAERWGPHTAPGDYNTAVMSLSANSSLSSYLLRGGVRMGLNFHPMVIGVMAVKDKRNKDFLMLETATVDPIWTEFDSKRKGRCTVPCLRDYGQVLRASGTLPLGREWESFEGGRGREGKMGGGRGFWGRDLVGEREEMWRFDKGALSKTPYRIEEDRYPPTNRTMENFFRGAWTYHVHNQWNKKPEPSSWLNVIQRAQDGFFSHGRMNLYGEKWEGPMLGEYEVSWEFT